MVVCYEISKAQLDASRDHSRRYTYRLVDAQHVAFAELEDCLEIESDAAQLEFDKEWNMFESLKACCRITHSFSFPMGLALHLHEVLRHLIRRRNGPGVCLEGPLIGHEL